MNNLIWYQICLDESHFGNLKDIISLAFQFLIRDRNECSVESLIDDVGFVKGDRRTRLTYENAFQQMFIRRNGPHPLLSKILRMKALQAMDPQPKFIKKNRLFYCHHLPCILIALKL